MRTVLLALLCSSTIVLAQNAPSLQFRGAQPLSKHAAINTPSVTTATASGEKVSLVVEMTPNPGIHVYAPGAKDYLPVKLTLKPQPDINIGKLTYPKSEMVHFEALNETVPVYHNAFKLLQDVTLEKSLKPGSTVAVAGTLEFQACDDKVCFVPESVPVSWTVAIK
jgi:DsbC/DsbD-like thiol-disulfide interchange protein